MKKHIFITAILIPLIMFSAVVAPVSANPCIISEPSFETIANWTYSENDKDFTDGAQSTNWTTQGTYSYLLSANGLTDIAKKKYSQVAQSVNFDTLDTISFDARLDAAQNGYFEVRVIVSTTEGDDDNDEQRDDDDEDNIVWSTTCTTTQTTYLHQEINVSEYTGFQNLIFRVVAVSKAKRIAMNAYFDNIKTWGSFNDLAHTTVNNYFDTGENTVYMYGENFEVSTAYHIGYYDGNNIKMLSDDVNSTSGGELSSLCYFPTYQATAAPGMWHAVVYKDPTAPPATYVANDPNNVVEDSFAVTQAAIPEFPTILAAIAVAGICFWIYYWIRRKMIYVEA